MPFQDLAESGSNGRPSSMPTLALAKSIKIGAVKEPGEVIRRDFRSDSGLSSDTRSVRVPGRQVQAFTQKGLDELWLVTGQPFSEP